MDDAKPLTPQSLTALYNQAVAPNLGNPPNLEDTSNTSMSNTSTSNSRSDKPYNILFILTDQERYFDSATLPEGYTLPGRERLKQRGVSFSNHQIASAVCTSSRSVIYTGRHIQQTKMFDNLDFPWANELPTDLGTVGQLLQKANYYCAYKGKWHLSNLGEHDEQDLPDPELSKIMAGYGFNDYVGIGDVIGMVHGGWINDDLTTAQAQRWLRVRGKPMCQQSAPWFLAVNLVNPHDVMFYNTDAPGEHIQDTPTPLIGLARAPNTPLYQQQWHVVLPKSRHEPFAKAGRPPAHQEYQRARDTQVGAFPNEDERWQGLLNYYHNCILATDQNIVTLLDELDGLGLAEDTIIVLTSDHGELGGSHGMHGKGTNAYQQQNHVPLIISHPAYAASHGQVCQALTSHVDLVPTMLAWTGTAPTDATPLTHTLPGHDLTPLLQQGAQAPVNALREGTLYCFNMLAYLDAAFMQQVRDLHNAQDTTKQNTTKQNTTKQNTAKQAAKPKAAGFHLDLSKRGAIRSVFDGRYKYSRYFSPKQHNTPQTIAEIFELNDVELFDLHNDPDELHNLAYDLDQPRALLLTMNAKLNKLIDDEVDGADDGHFLPDKVVSSTATKAARQR